MEIGPLTDDAGRHRWIAMTSTWFCEVPECGAENGADTTRCVRCGAVRGETIAPSRPSTNGLETAPASGSAAERKRNMVFFYLAIWIPIMIWIVIVFATC